MRSICSRMAMTSRAASGVLTVMRTSSEPAWASSLTWMAVAMGSAVSVLVMDCTTTGAVPPTATWRSPHFTMTERVSRRGAAPTAGGGASWQGGGSSCMRVPELRIYLGKPGRRQPVGGQPTLPESIGDQHHQQRQDDQQPAPGHVAALVVVLDRHRTRDAVCRGGRRRSG